MLRKLLFGFFALLFVAAVGYFYFFFNKNIKPPVSDAVKAIPINASLVFESRSPLSLFKKVASSSLIWSDLVAINYFDSLNKDLHFLDSMMSKENDLLNLQGEQSFYLSTHRYSSNGLGYLFVFELPNSSVKSKVDMFISNKFSKSKVVKSTYDKVVINTIEVSPKKFFCYTVYKNVFISSFVKELVETAIGQFSGSVSLLNDPSFVKVMESSGDRKDAWLYINYKTFPDLLNRFIDRPNWGFSTSLTGFAGWSEWDCTFSSNEIMLNGFTVCKDSLGNYLSLFARQEPQRANITSVIPSGVSFFQFFGISNMRFFLNDYRMYLEAKHKYFEYEQYWEELNRKLKIKSDEKFSQLIGNEMALVVTGSMADRLEDDVFAVFQLKDESASDKLVRLSDTLAMVLKQDIDTLVFHRRTIHKLPITSFIYRLFGTPFEKNENNFFVILGNYVVFANSTFALQNYISAYDNGRVLSKDAAYLDFSKEHLTKETNLYMYGNVSRFANLYSYYAPEDIRLSVENNLDVYRKFQSMAITFSSSKGMFYSTIYLKHNPETKNQISSLWETPLDVQSTTKPVYLFNHTNKTKDVFVQDDSNSIYLISNTGKLFWKRPMPERIISEIYQVDLYKNDKYQMLFNTESMLYVVDRNGKDVKGFPIKLPTKANGGLALFDYSNNRDYRFFIPAFGKNIHVYNGKGERIKDFDPKINDEVNVAPVYLPINGKDYIVFVDRLGKVYVTDRHGDIQVNIASQLPSDKFYLDIGKDISSSRLLSVDSIGTIHILWFSGKNEQIETEEYDGVVEAQVNDIDNDKINEVILLNNNNLYVFDLEGNRKFTVAIKDEVLSAPTIYKYKEKVFLIAVSTSTNQVFAFDSSGKLYPDFPVFGATAVDIGSTANDNTLQLVTISGNKVYLYQLQ